MTGIYKQLKSLLDFVGRAVLAVLASLIIHFCFKSQSSLYDVSVF
jgi:hypothetical protein